MYGSIKIRVNKITEFALDEYDSILINYNTLYEDTL